MNQDRPKADGLHEKITKHGMSTETSHDVFSDKGVHVPCQGCAYLKVVATMCRGEKYMSHIAVLCEIRDRGGDAP